MVSDRRPKLQGVIQYSDGSWAVIGGDGWPIDLADLTAEDLAELRDMVCEVIDVTPIAVHDTEIQPRELPERTS